MNIGDDERKQLLREIGDLVDDFKSLRLANAKGTIRTERESILSLSPTPKPSASTLRLLAPRSHSNADSIVFGEGLEQGWAQPKSVDDFDLAPIHYARLTGQSIVNSAGQSLVLKSGWSTIHQLELNGSNASEVLATIKRANAWACRRCQNIWQALGIDRSVTFQSFCWPDVALQIAEHGDATMTKPEWMVEIGLCELVADGDGDGVERLQATINRRRQSMSVEMWKRRHDNEITWDGTAEPFVSISKADELYIGDEPELMYCQYEVKPFLRDSELALDCLRRKIESDTKQTVTPESKTQPIVSVDDKKNIEAIVATLEKRFKLAYLAAQNAEQRCGKILTDRESFEWLKENGMDGYSLPMFDTFTDYLTKARRATAEQRKRPRAGRTARSLVKQSEI